MKRYQESIICPKCRKIQTANVELSIPWHTYVHNCECGYIIMESEWHRSSMRLSSIEDESERDAFRKYLSKHEIDTPKLLDKNDALIEAAYLWDYISFRSSVLFDELRNEWLSAK